MRDFRDADEFARFLGGLANGFEHSMRLPVDRAARNIRATARGMLGTYQGADKGTPAWAQLAETTKKRRAAQGFPANEPLLVTGALRASITHRTAVGDGGVEAVVGSNSPYAVIQERGGVAPSGNRIPPRPFLAKAAARGSAPAAVEIGAAAALVVAGKSIKRP